jgi:hypothetical protein
MKQIAINGLTYVRKIRAQSIAGPLWVRHLLSN